VSRDARDDAVVDVECVLADRKHCLSRIPDVDAATGEVTMREYPIETQGVMSLETAAGEFRAVTAHSRAISPHLHLVISWRDGEHPTNTQAFEAGRAALASLGLDAYQHVMAVHREETGNDHLHVAVNRVHPETYRGAYLSKSYYALDRAMREIELRQGSERDSGRYEVRYREDGTPEIARAERENDGPDRVDASANVKTRARSFGVSAVIRAAKCGERQTTHLLLVRSLDRLPLNVLRFVRAFIAKQSYGLHHRSDS